MMKSDASLKGKIKALAKKSNLKPQELLQMYLFEHLLVRLGKSGYAETFVLKGGLLISSMTGIAQRTTMDMDATAAGIAAWRDLSRSGNPLRSFGWALLGVVACTVSHVMSVPPAVGAANSE